MSIVEAVAYAGWLRDTLKDCYVAAGKSGDSDEDLDAFINYHHEMALRDAGVES